MPAPSIQTTFASGEWAPKLRSRVDIQKYKAGAALLRNFFVDYAGGGASTRQGFEFIAGVGGTVPTTGGIVARLIPFQPSVNISYVLEFGQNYIRFYSNGAQIVSGGIPYQISSPYNASDLFPNPATGNPGLKFVQDVTSLIITHPSYPPQILTITDATTWTLTAITFGPTLSAPTGTTLGTSVGGSGWFYSYIVTAVDNNGIESEPSAVAANGGAGAGLINTTNPSLISLTWNAVAGAVSYNIYKASPQNATAVASGAQYGFVSNVTGTHYLESYPGIGPDFSQTPPIIASPIVGGTVTAIHLTSGGGGFTSVPTVTIATAPTGGFTATAQASATIVTFAAAGLVQIQGNLTPAGATILFANGISALITSAGQVSGSVWDVSGLQLTNGGSVTTAGTALPSQIAGTDQFTGGPANGNYLFITGNLFNVTWGIGAVNLIQGGFGYTSAPAVTFSPNAGASATTTVSPINNTGNSVLGAGPVGNPRACAFEQERLVLASPNAGLQSFYMSQPGSFFNFNVSNPSESDDGIFGSIISEQLNDIRSLVSVPTGLLALTGKGAWLINGGGGISTSSPITPSSITATPQAFNGANDLRPLRTNLDLLYATNKGCYVRDQTYNIYANIFTGSDITVLSNHLFFGHTLVDWTWAEEPFKTVWAVRDDGIMLSLAYLKEQDLIGWAWHDTNGQFMSVCSVIETVDGVNNVDAVYVIVQRFINGAFVQYVERMADRYFPFGYEDSWSVDCGLQTTPAVSPTTNLTVTGAINATGASVTLTDSASSPFLSTMVGWVVRSSGAIFAITGFTSTSQVTATITRTPNTFNSYTNSFIPAGYTIWQPVTSVSNLTQLVGQSVVGVADGTAVGPLTVSAGGAVTLPSAASKVTLGLAYTPRLMTLPLDPNQKEMQGKRKKIPAVILRTADTLGLQVGTTFSNVVTVKDLQIGAVPSLSTGVTVVSDLVNPSSRTMQGALVTDARQILDQLWQEPGQFCIQQNLPYPATILGVMPEITEGDTAK